MLWGGGGVTQGYPGEEKGRGLAGGRKIYQWIKIQNSNQSKKALQKTRLDFGKNPKKKNPWNEKTQVDFEFMNSIL
jgi:hypothetical protein